MLEIFERGIPPRYGIHFAEHKRFIILFGCRNALLYRPITFAGKRKIIDTRVVHVRIVSHHRSAELRLVRKLILVQNVPREQQIIVLTPLVIRARERIEKQSLYRFDIPIRRLIGILAKIQTRQVCPQIFAPIGLIPNKSPTCCLYFSCVDAKKSCTASGFIVSR